jgi:hypothetical protein
MTPPVPTPPAARRNALTAVLAAAGVFAVYLAFQAVVVHSSFDGNYAGAFMFAKLFGIPEAEREAGITPVLFQDPGWDGQFYYHLSNDPLVRRDTAKHVDSIIYRGQRIGFPALAYAASRGLGYAVTPPRLYLTLQWAVIAAGFGALVWWLGATGVPRLYAVVWGLSFGLLHPTAHGLNDGVADAWLIFSLVALHRERLGWYALFATLMLLTREGYAAFAGGVWLATALGVARFSGRGYLGRVALCSLPLLAMLGWTAYLCSATGLPPNHGRQAGTHMIDKPLVAAYKFTLKNFADGDHTEILWRVGLAFTLVVVSVRAARFARTSPPTAAALPYLLLTMMLGAMVWENHTGYPKAMTGVLVIGLFLLPFDRSVVLRFALAVSFVCGLEMLYHTRVKQPWVWSSKMADSVVPPPEYTGPPAAPLADVRSTAEWAEPSAVVEIQGTTAWKFLRREVVPFRIRLTNKSDATWPPLPRTGAMAVHVGCKVYREDDGILVAVATTPLARPVGPGESVQATVCVPLRRGRYIAVVSGVQHAHRWFHEVDPAFGDMRGFEVR